MLSQRGGCMRPIGYKVFRRRRAGGRRKPERSSKTNFGVYRGVEDFGFCLLKFRVRQNFALPQFLQLPNLLGHTQTLGIERLVLPGLPGCLCQSVANLCQSVLVCGQTSSCCHPVGPRAFILIPCPKLFMADRRRPRRPAAGRL